MSLQERDAWERQLKAAQEKKHEAKKLKGTRLAHGMRAMQNSFQSQTPKARLTRRLGLGVVKKGSLCEAIAGTINRSDFARIDVVYEESPAVQQLLPKSAGVMTALRGLTSQPVTTGEEVLERSLKLASRPQFDVIQLRVDGYGYILKHSAAPKGVKPQERKVSKEAAQKALPQEMVNTADQQGVATVTEVQAAPDPMQEQPQAVTQFGMYKVTEATGGQLVGFVIPQLFDPVQGVPVQQGLFFTGGQYALAPQFQGVLTGVSHNLPESGEPRGLGIFYHTDGKGLLATVPYTIISKVTAEGVPYYAAQTQTGDEVQVKISQEIVRPLAATPGEIIIPANFKWLALDNEVQLIGPEADPMAAQKAASVGTLCEIRAWRHELGAGGGVDLQGPVFSKLGSGTHTWADGLFYLAAAGMPQNLALACIDKAASSGQVVKMYGLAPLTDHDDMLKDAAAEAVADFKRLDLPERPLLLKEALAIESTKEARALVGTNAVDHLLALNFINPENVETFVEYLPELEDTASKLAQLTFAVQLGLQSVPKTAAIHAMRSLDAVIASLKALRQYKV